jgi:WD40 repeat protein
MPAPPQRPDSPAGSAWPTLEPILRAFEDAWRRGERPTIDAHLPVDINRSLALVELTKMELEWRLRAGEAARVEDYLVRYPELALKQEAVLALVLLEYSQRQRSGATDALPEYLGRFPQLARELQAQLPLSSAFAPTGPLATTPPAIVVNPTGLSLHLPGYEIVGELGRGGMGAVYRAWDVGLKRAVALKVILDMGPAGSEERTRFQREAEVVARLNHPGIVQIHHVGQHEDQPFLVLELVEGGSLAGKLRGQPVPARQAATLVAQLAHAVQAAHEAGIVHRDLKPANVLVGPRWQLKVTDFGLAKKMDDPGHTHTGAVLGTPAYMAPEQALGLKVGPRADLYALGVILYELLCGKPPFRGGTVIELLQQVIADDPVVPSRLNPKTPRDLELICLKCLEKEPPDRYASAADLADELGRFLAGEPVRVRPAGRMERLWRQVRRNPTKAALVALTAVVLLLTGIGALATRRASRYRDQSVSLGAEVESQRAQEEEQQQQGQRRQREARHDRQLTRVRVLWPMDPERGLRLLADEAECPADLLDERWRQLGALCRRSRETQPALAEGFALSSLWSIAVSPRGDLVAVEEPAEEGKRRVRLLDSRSGREVRRLPIDPKPGGSLSGMSDRFAFSPGGELFLYHQRAAYESTKANPLARTQIPDAVTVWNVATGKLAWEFRPETQMLGPVTFSGDGRTLVLVLDKGLSHEILLLDAPTGKERQRLGSYEGRILALFASADAGRLALLEQVYKPLTLEGQIRLMAEAQLTVRDVATGKVIASQPAENRVGVSETIALSPDGKTLFYPGPPPAPPLTIPPSAILRRWDLDRARPLPDWTLPDSGRGTATGIGIMVLRASGDGKVVAAGTTTGAVIVLDAKTGKILLNSGGNQRKTWQQLTFIEGSQGLVSLPTMMGTPCSTRSVQCWDLKTGQSRPMLQPESSPLGVASSRHGALLAIGLSSGRKGQVQGQVLLHALAQQSPSRSMPAGDGPVRVVAVSASGEQVAFVSEAVGLPASLRDVGAKQSRLLLWKTGEPKGPTMLSPFKHPQAQLPLTPPAGLNQLEAAWYVWSDLTALAFDDAGKNLAGCDSDGIFVYDLATNQKRWKTGPRGGFSRGGVTCLAFSPDGRILAVGEGGILPLSASPTVPPQLRLLDANTGAEVAIFPGHAGAVHWLAFSEDGDWLASAALVRGADGRPAVELKEWDVSKMAQRLGGGKR